MKVEELKKIIDQYIEDYKAIGQYEVKLHEFGEYGSSVELPINRIEVNIDEGVLLICD